MSPAPSVIVFDVNETLSDMSPIAQRFADIGAPGTWPSSGSPPCCATASHSPPRARPFTELGASALRTVLHGVDLNRDLPAAVEQVMNGFGTLAVHLTCMTASARSTARAAV